MASGLTGIVLGAITLDATPALIPFVLIFTFVLGSVFGSFLNVVIYRLPRGENLSHPPSRCPACKHPIRWYDNVPILGWLWLRGRCRDCGHAIARRYPLVELLVALLSAYVGLTSLLVIVGGIDSAEPLRVDVDFAPYLLQVLLVCTLIAAAGMELDDQAPPLRLPVFSLCVGFAIVLWQGWRADAALHGATSSSAASGFYGGAAGLLLAALAWPGSFRTGSARDMRRAVAGVLMTVLVGSYLGVRAVSIIALGVSLLQYALVECRAWWPAARHLGWFVSLAIVTIAWLVVAPLLAGANASGALELLICNGLAVAVLAIITRLARRSVPAISR